MGTLTLKNVSAVRAPSSKGTFYAVEGINRAAREALDKTCPYLGASKMPSGYWLLNQDQLLALTAQIQMGVAE